MADLTVPETSPPASVRYLPTTRVAIGTLAALAAGVALFLGSMAVVDPQTGSSVAGRERSAAPAPAVLAKELIRARSTQTLFDPGTPFARRGGESSRVDRIARARAADLRANRFAAWGVE